MGVLKQVHVGYVKEIVIQIQIVLEISSAFKEVIVAKEFQVVDMEVLEILLLMIIAMTLQVLQL